MPVCALVSGSHGICAIVAVLFQFGGVRLLNEVDCDAGLRVVETLQSSDCHGSGCRDPDRSSGKSYVLRPLAVPGSTS